MTFLGPIRKLRSQEKLTLTFEETDKCRESTADICLLGAEVAEDMN